MSQPQPGQPGARSTRLNPQAATPLHIAAWACFLGCSWTWVIGMLLPILLVRDYGVWGFVVFAAPNVLGAMAMGLVLQAPGRAARVLDEHRVMAGVFSNFTWVFHLLVLCWISAAMLGWPSVVMLLVLVPVARLLNIASPHRTRHLLVAAVGVAIFSWVLWAMCSGFDGAWTMPAASRLSTTDLLLFAPASVLGFVLCPYLDRTFYRARIALPGRAGGWAFVLGFCGVFFSMILFALMYAGVAQPIFQFEMRNRISYALPAVWLAPLAAFWMIQAVFTMTLHEPPEERGTAGGRATSGSGAELIGIGAIGAAAILGVLVLRYDLWPLAWRGGLTPFEVGYRVFLLGYGVVFPAYVWLCMLPTRRPAPLAGKVKVFFVASVLALPMGYAGFVLAQAWWTLGVLAVLLAARGVVMWQSRRPQRKTRAEPGGAV